MAKNPVADDRFLRANLNDPDNQAALLRAYLETKQRAGQLEAKLVEAEEERNRREAERQEGERQNKAAAKRAQDDKTARLERLGEAMSLTRWAAEWADKGAAFLSGTRQNLGQIIDLASTGAEACERLRYNKDLNVWTFTWGNGRPDTVIGLFPLAAGGANPGGAAPGLARRRRPFAGAPATPEPGSH